MSEVIKAEHISKSYGKLSVLNDVCFSVKKGDFVSIVGSSGAGKSTLLQIIGTLDTPDSGSLFINGNNVRSFDSKKLAYLRNQDIGFVFQFHNLLPEFTALENVCIPGFIARKNKNDVLKRANELMEAFGIFHRQDHRPSELSGGEQQRVAVARALINQPSIILADEPSGNLDEDNANELHSHFEKLKNIFHQTLLVVTHNKDLSKIADRTLVLKNKQIVEV